MIKRVIDDIKEEIQTGILIFIGGFIVGGFAIAFIARCGESGREQDLISENYFLNIQLEEKDKIIESLHKKYNVNRKI